MATLLCSMLLGAGYDAFVVMGTAPYRVAAGNRRSEVCPDGRGAAGVISGRNESPGVFLAAFSGQRRAVKRIGLPGCQGVATRRDHAETGPCG